MQIDLAVEAKVRDAIGHCMYGHRDEVERILVDLAENGQLLEAIKMWAFVSLSSMRVINAGNMTDSHAAEYVKGIIETQRCGFIDKEERPLLSEALESIWNGQVSVVARPHAQLTFCILEAAAYFMGSTLPVGMTPNHLDPDAVDPWWEELDKVWQEFSALPETVMKVEAAEAY